MRASSAIVTTRSTMQSRSLAAAPFRRQIWRALCTPSEPAAPPSRWQRLRAERRAAPPPKRRIPRDAAAVRPTEPAELSDALSYVRAAAWASFDETVELTLRLGIDMRQSSQIVRTHAVLPHPHGIARRVAILDDGDWDPPFDSTTFLSGPNLLDEVVESKGRALKGVGLAIAPSLMAGEVAKRAGRLLGPKGLLPNAKEGTVVRSVSDAADKAARRWVRLKADRHGTVHVAVGKVSMEMGVLEENVVEVVKRILEAKPVAIKRSYLKGASICSTMGPGVRLDLETLTKAARLRRGVSETM